MTEAPIENGADSRSITGVSAPMLPPATWTPQDQALFDEYERIVDQLIEHFHNRDELNQIFHPSERLRYFQQLMIEPYLRLTEQCDLDLDPLTKLGWRRQFFRHLNILYRQYPGFFEGFAVIMMDLDHFKPINDNFGHPVGDEALEAFVDRVRSIIGDEGRLYRLSGDEFVILLPFDSDYSAPLRMATRIEAEATMLYQLSGVKCFLSVSTGMAYTDEDNPVDLHPAEIFEVADLNLVRRKARRGTNPDLERVVEFGRPRDLRHVRQLQMQLRMAVEGKWWELRLQPIVNIEVFHPDSQLAKYSGRIVGFEQTIVFTDAAAELLRFYNTEQKLDEIQRMNLLQKLTEDVIEALLDVMEQIPPNLDLLFSTNIRPTLLTQPDLVDFLEYIVEKRQVKSHRLGLEITEHDPLPSLPNTQTQLERLSEDGFNLVLDDVFKLWSGMDVVDFVNRYGRLAAVKFDGKLIAEMMTRPAFEIMLGSLIDGIHRLGTASPIGKIRTVAECVETEEQLRKLIAMGCGYAQGNYFSPPLTVDQTLAMVRNLRRFELPRILSSDTP